MEIYDLGTQTVFIPARAELSSSPIGRGEIVSAIIRNPLTNAAGTPNVIEVLVGDGGTQLWDLLPGAQSPEIFASDLKDVYIRVRVAVGLVVATDVIVMAHRYAEPVRDVSRQKRRRR